MCRDDVVGAKVPGRGRVLAPLPACPLFPAGAESSHTARSLSLCVCPRCFPSTRCDYIALCCAVRPLHASVPCCSLEDAFGYRFCPGISPMPLQPFPPATLCNPPTSLTASPIVSCAHSIRPAWPLAHNNTIPSPTPPVCFLEDTSGRTSSRPAYHTVDYIPLSQRLLLLDVAVDPPQTVCTVLHQCRDCGQHYSPTNTRQSMI
jgi:hypothetical protein